MSSPIQLFNFDTLAISANNLFGVTMKKMGIECTFVDQELPEEELDKYFKPNTKAVFGETITNPTVSIFDFEKFAGVNVITNFGAIGMEVRKTDLGSVDTTTATISYSTSF